jgi:hypothetical protein
MFLIYYQNKLQKRDIAILTLCIIAFGYVLLVNSTSVISSIIDQQDGSGYARIGAIRYYLSKFPHNLLFGLGLVIPNKNSEFFQIIKGPLGIYNYDDIGVFGIFASLGVTGFLWYVHILIKIWIMHKLTLEYSALFFGFSVLMIISMFTMSYLDNARIIGLVFMFALEEAICMKQALP